MDMPTGLMPCSAIRSDGFVTFSLKADSSDGLNPELETSHKVFLRTVKQIVVILN